MEFYWLLVLHMVGDYLLQSDWMAQKKTTSSVPAAAHAVVYTAPFWLLMPSWTSMLIIGGTHFVIDRWRLARYVCWAKNFLGPSFTYGVAFNDGCRPGAVGYYAAPGSVFEGMVDKAITTGEPIDGERGWYWARRADRFWHRWADCSGTGYHKDRPAWLAVWLLIIADNTLHLGFNGLAWVLFTTGT